VAGDQIHRHGRHHSPEVGRRHAQGQYFLRRLYKDDVSDASPAPAHLQLQRRPGSASVWLHLGLFGPRRVQMGDAGTLLPPPYKLWTTTCRYWTSATSSSLIPSRLGTAAPFLEKRRNNFTASPKTLSPSRISSGSMPRRNNAGRRRNSWLAKATATTARCWPFRLSPAALRHVPQRHRLDLGDSEISRRRSSTLAMTCRISSICRPTRPSLGITRNSPRICRVGMSKRPSRNRASLLLENMRTLS